MSPKDSRKYKNANNSNNESNNFNNNLKVSSHKKTLSTASSILSNNSSNKKFPDFLRSNSYNDINSMSSGDNSFTSLTNIYSSTNANHSSHNSLQNSLSLGGSLESLNSLSNTSNKLKNNRHIKRNLFSNLREKNRKNKNVPISTSVIPIDNSTIMEDDESDQALNVPMLPAFNNKSNMKTPVAEIPAPKPLQQTDPFNPNILEPTRLTTISQSLNPFDPINTSINGNRNVNNIDKINDRTQHDDTDNYLKTTIDQDFDVNFSKDSHMSRGEKILKIRKQKGLKQQQNRRPILHFSSSDDDTSTENDSSDNNDNDNVKKFSPKGDNDSIKSDDSKHSIKQTFKNFFRRRAFSIGNESIKSVKSNESKHDTNMNNNEDNDNLSDINEKNEVNETNFSSGTGSDITKSSQHDNTKPNTSIFNENFNDLTEKDISSINGKSSSKLNHNERNSFDDKELRSITSSNKSEHFLKNIFHLDGLLGQGGLTPNLNLRYNKKHKPGFDEENPPPNFQDEIKGEAEVLVGHMFKNPVYEMRRRKNARINKNNENSNLNSANNPYNTSLGDGTNNTEDANTTTTNGNPDNNSTDCFYVPDGGHLDIDPFDDLQDIHNLSIDIPDNLKDKPRKYRSGIQSALLQLYNTHFIPSANAPSMSRGSSSMDGTTIIDSRNESSDNLNDLHMDLGDEILKNGLGTLHPHEASNVLDAELPELGTKVEEITENAETHFDDLAKIHKRASSLQNIIFGKEKLKLSNHLLSNRRKSLDGNNNKTTNNSKKKSEVTFDLPNFASKPSASFVSTPYEKQELLGYKNFKKRARFNKKLTKETTARITVHIADVLERQRFILTLCKAFMLYGAPTHRLEEYMSMTAQVLEIDGSFIYFPGCMLVSFGDLNARTSEMKLVRCAQGLDLGKLDEVHDVYKNVVHDRLGTVEGYEILDEIMNRKPKFNAWWCIFFYSVASVAVAPWSFGGSWMDLPICFGIGAIIAFLQFVVCPKNTLYSSVFEVCSSIIASFIARAIGSVNNGNTFCYAALVQSPLALILPGYIILCGSLELQSRNIVAGSVRMFYAFIYSLMLSFGMTLGAALYGWIDKNATSATSCSSNISPWYYFLFIPMFTIGIALTNQASWSQLPMMSFISGAGYIVSYFSSRHFKEVTELNATLGCFIIGLVSNIYSRLLKSLNKYFTTRGFMTVSLMLPGIFVQVPSGIASQGSVFTGITTANSLVYSNSTDTSSQTTSNENALSFGMVMIQVALGISVGLYLSTILVYPFGKKNTGLFTL